MAAASHLKMGTDCLLVVRTRTTRETPRKNNQPAWYGKECQMRQRFLISIGTAAFLAWLPAAAQTPFPAAKPAAKASSAAKSFTPPKTPWGDPDIQGLWPADSQIPMQRPLTQAEKNALSPEELARREEQFRKQAEADNEEFAPAKGATTTINPPGYWVERAKPNVQTSLVMDPPDGRIPPLTPEGQKRLKELRGGLGPGEHFPSIVNSWEAFDIYSRCISRC